MKDYTYEVHLVTPKGDEVIFPMCKDVCKARRVALKIKEKPTRRVYITRDGKKLPGGKYALDKECMALWFLEREEE